jgi:hypothetical protein
LSSARCVVSTVGVDSDRRSWTGEEVCERERGQFKSLLGENFGERERKVHEPCTWVYLRSESSDDVLPTAMDRAPGEMNGVNGHGRLRLMAATSGISVRSR